MNWDDFELFLWLCDCHGRYFRNFASAEAFGWRKETDIEIGSIEEMKQTDRDQWINSAFWWSEDDEDFWMSVNELWQSCCMENKMASCSEIQQFVLDSPFEAHIVRG